MVALKEFALSAPEVLMIANIRPEAYAHITPLIIDIHARFDDDQVYVCELQLTGVDHAVAKS